MKSDGFILPHLPRRVVVPLVITVQWWFVCKDRVDMRKSTTRKVFREVVSRRGMGRVAGGRWDCA